MRTLEKKLRIEEVRKIYSVPSVININEKK
jgi:hypothetical protein